MELGLRLSQKQTLKLVMTPRLQQALKLLQMPSLELSQHIEQELLTNPLLELDETPPENLQEPATADSDKPEATDKELAPEEKALDAKEDKLDWSEYFDDGFEYADGGRADREETEFFERVPVGRATLVEELTEQLHLLDLDPETMRIAEYILGCLADNGFLAIPLDEITAELAVTPELAQKALAAVQKLDPPGIGARDLPESLLIQLRLLGRSDSLAAAIVRDHFEAFKQRHYQEIARALKVEPVDIQDAAQEISHLNPRPGAQLALEDARYVVPDLVVEKVDDQYVVSLADGSVPRLKVSRKYREILVQGKNGSEPPKTEPGGSEAEAEGAGATHVKTEAQVEAAADAASARATRKEEELKFVQDKLKSANWLIQTIEQRRRTMVKVMEAIVEAQIDFFEQKPRSLRPLTLQDVAERIGMHESTVSRVTTNKYVQTPRGLFPLKYFFSSGLDTETGESVSSKMAMARIQELIDREDRKKPLSDQKIAELLRKEGLIVARRTVAKYRERMGVLSARLRKEF